MHQILSSTLRSLLIGLIALGLILPATAPAKTTDDVAKCAVQKKKSLKNKSNVKSRSHANNKNKNRKISRYGKRRMPVTRISPAEKRRLMALANLPHRVGSTEIFQSSSVQSTLLLESRAAIVINAETGELLYSKNPSRTMPIASITKLMTAMVVLDARLPMDELIAISKEDIDQYRHTSSRLAVGTTLPRSELLLLALMASENRAAAALARSYPGGTPAAINAMNRKARELGMTNTQFSDGTGLHSENRASPTDLVRMVKAARSYPEIHKDTTTSEHIVYSHGRAIAYHNTNALVKSDTWNIEVSKTGFINEAGKCLVMQARINATPVVIVLMDSSGRYTRIGDANRVKKWLESAMSQNI